MTAPGNHQDGTEAPGSALEVAAALLQRSPSIGDPTASSAVTIPQSHQCEEPCKIDVGYFSKTAASRPRPMQMDMDAISNRVFMTYIPSPCKPDGFEEAKRDFWMERMAQRPGQMQGLLPQYNSNQVRILWGNPFMGAGPMPPAPLNAPRNARPLGLEQPLYPAAHSAAVAAEDARGRSTTPRPCGGYTAAPRETAQVQGPRAVAAAPLLAPCGQGVRACSPAPGRDAPP